MFIRSTDHIFQLSSHSVYHPPVSASVGGAASTSVSSSSTTPAAAASPRPQNLNRETVYLEKSIAETFGLKAFKNVIVKKVNREEFALDLIELTFREQYLGRSEMWRLKSALVGTGVFLNKKVDLCKDAVRLTVNQMWKDVRKQFS